ncbi:hypothetical protein SMKI_16G0660 [Saccharomyces mikatae IFO 1815]|uniref:Xylulose kinase n=1 Tax=Saccharomyces mikatae IFO 1815 TaxID=226126 RepID=A0AA35ITR4_SACMI|nr:uncharacterized protein SMKI_16G0660 [Saccharomyces mikatae IFO 1815]CAI4036762.1 hypothetical protein SMKI_16G0660 [Saccharomyces mikatae IFO 1815]
MSLDSYYLGFDLSTQQLKCLAIDQNLKIVHSETVEFEKELSHYHTKKGVYIHGDTIECPVAMWLEALDLVLLKYHKAKFPLERVMAISGSCQQHGSVYWSSQAESLLEQLNRKSEKDLLHYVGPAAFSRQTAPNWQDRSTAKQCQEFEQCVGGPEKMAQLTGSRAHFRFTGPQILKISQLEPETYEKTKAISLVSNFLTTILVGHLVGLEEADACGMNLYDIRERKFSDELLNLIDSSSKDKTIRQKLMGTPMKTMIVGTICKYFVEKYGFNANCKVSPMTGDNLATICSLPLRKNDVLVSLGTSTTVLLVTDKYHPSPNYHLFIHPTLPGHYMGMICYCNGSLAREKIREQLNSEHAEKSDDWALFNQAVLDDSENNDNELGVYFPLGEIVPSVKAVEKRVIYDTKTGRIERVVEKFKDKTHDAKNIVESQALSCRVRISPLLSDSNTRSEQKLNEDTIVKFDYDESPLREYLNKRPERTFFVGGASKNEAIVKKFAQVIGATKGNFRLETPNSCALGGCYKAMWSFLYDSDKITAPFDKFLNENFPWHVMESVSDVNNEKWDRYNSKIVPLSELEKTLT